MSNIEPVVKQQKTPHRWKKGECGNLAGRPRKPEIEQLRQALHEAETKYEKTLLNHLVERAYVNDSVLIALAKKLVPDLSAVSGETAVKGFNLIIKRPEPAIELKTEPQALPEPEDKNIKK